MKEFTIGPNDAGQRVDRWLAKTVPLLPAALAQKYIRLKRVKRNGKRTERDARLAVGDTLQLYINDEFFDAPTPENAFLKIASPKLDILYEDDQILLVNKAPGVVVHADETEQVNTLINHILAYLYQKKEWDPRRENTFAPALCNRIDRNTGGIVIAAKTAEALRVMNQKIRDRELTKRYLCAAVGQLRPADGTLKSWLRRDEQKKQVYVTADETEQVNTLINHILAYLYQKKEWDPRRENTFAPALCNRIDRNTGGIVIAAKTAEALRVMNQKIRDRELTKRYLCAAVGQLRPADGTLKSWLRRDEQKKQVYVTAKPAPGARTAITKYRTLTVQNGLSLVECDLITGRTHQIRAQLAYAGHPLLGDGKYGQEAVNRRWHRKGQALWSWYLRFQFTTPAGELEYLNGKHWQVNHIDFVQELFPGFDLSRIPPRF